MRSSTVVLALAGSALSQTTTTPIQGLTGVANFLTTFQNSLPNGYGAFAAQAIPFVTKAIGAFLPQATTVADVQNAISSPQLLVPAVAYAQIPPNVLNGAEYYVALQAAPQVLSVVASDASTFLNVFPKTLALTDMASFVSASPDAFGSAVTSLVNTALPQAEQILTALASQASAIAPAQTTGCSAAVTTPIATVPTTTATASASGNFTVPVSTTIATGSPTPSIITGAASNQKAAIGFVVGAVVAVAALL